MIQNCHSKSKNFKNYYEKNIKIYNVFLKCCFKMTSNFVKNIFKLQNDELGYLNGSPGINTYKLLAAITHSPNTPLSPLIDK